MSSSMIRHCYAEGLRFVPSVSPVGLSRWHEQGEEEDGSCPRVGSRGQRGASVAPHRTSCTGVCEYCMPSPSHKFHSVKVTLQY